MGGYKKYPKVLSLPPAGLPVPSTELWIRGAQGMRAQPRAGGRGRWFHRGKHKAWSYGEAGGGVGLRDPRASPQTGSDGSVSWGVLESGGRGQAGRPGSPLPPPFSATSHHPDSPCLSFQHGHPLLCGCHQGDPVELATCPSRLWWGWGAGAFLGGAGRTDSRSFLSFSLDAWLLHPETTLKDSSVPLCPSCRARKCS